MARILPLASSRTARSVHLDLTLDALAPLTDASSVISDCTFSQIFAVRSNEPEAMTEPYIGCAHDNLVIVAS